MMLPGSKHLLAATFLTTFAWSSAGAVSIGGSTGLEGLGAFTGTLTYTSLSSTQATLTVSLTNTSPTSSVPPIENGGFITAFVLNNPNNAISSISFSQSGDGQFNLIPLDNDEVNGAPFGQFDFGATTDTSPGNNSFEGGGNPNRGLGFGESGTFVFTLTGIGLNALTEASFLQTTSVGPGAGEGVQSLVVRFRGFDTDPPGSDKVPDTIGGGEPDVTVPTPAALALFGVGMLGLAAARRRRRRHAAA